MRKLFTSALFFLTTLAFCQHKGNFCSTSPSTKKGMPMGWQQLQTTEANSCPLTTYQVRVYFHFVSSSSNPGYNSSHISTMLGNLNSTFSPYGITFVSDGSRSWVNETFGSPNTSPLAFAGIFTASGSNPVSNAINLYIIPANSQLQGGKANGIPSNALFVSGTRLVRFNCNDTTYPVPLTRVIAHEVGHCLGLNHTYDEITGDGDGLSDTPLDKSISESCISPAPNCAFVGQQSGGCNTCPISSNPTSEIKNVMAANLPDCMSDFSSMQLAIMRQNLAGSLNYLVQSSSVVSSQPNLQTMTYGTQGGGTNNTVYTVNSVNANTWYIIRTNLNSSDLTSPIPWSHPGGINAFAGGTNNVDYYVNLSSGQSVTINVAATNLCGTSTRNITFTTSSGYRVYSNPAKDRLTVEFDQAEYQEALPDQLELVREETMKAVRSVKIKDEFDKSVFKDSKKVEFQVADLPRGIYYLRVTNSRLEKEKQVEITRVLLE